MDRWEKLKAVKEILSIPRPVLTIDLFDWIIENDKNKNLRVGYGRSREGTSLVQPDNRYYILRLREGANKTLDEQNDECVDLIYNIIK